MYQVSNTSKDKEYEVGEQGAQIDYISDVLRKIDSERVMGMVLREKGMYDDAEEKLSSALERSRNIGSKLEECKTLLEFGILEEKRGRSNREKPSMYFEEVEKIAEKCGFELYRKKAVR